MNSTADKTTDATTGTEPRIFDLADSDVRELNSELHAPTSTSYVVRNPRGAHAVAAGVHDDIEVRIEDDVGYFCAGMNQRAHIRIEGSAGPGVAENMMSGSVWVTDDASQSAGATAHGGLLVIEGNASTRCGISLKGADIVVHGNIGAMSAFMAQAGRIVVCGNAADGLGDSIYEARIYIRGTVGELGADCIEKEMRSEHRAELAELLRQSGKVDEAGDEAYLSGFRRYGSGRTLYHFNSDQSGSY